MKRKKRVTSLEKTEEREKERELKYWRRSCASTRPTLELEDDHRDHEGIRALTCLGAKKATRRNEGIRAVGSAEN